MKHNSDKMPIAPMSSQPCSKPNVGGSKSQEVGRYTNLLAINVSTIKIITHKYLL
jgi:hypothetical protein